MAAQDEALSPLDVAIVGGGAAGLATAIFAARSNAARRIAVFDGAKTLGAKILVSGGGRCNVTNVRVTPQDFWGGNRHAVRAVLAAFSERQTVEFFGELGVTLHEEACGKLFPDTNKARTVLDALLRECARVGIEICATQRVTDIRRGADGVFEIVTAAGATRACAVVLATGGQSLPKTGSDGFGYTLAQRLGHRVTPRTPALAPLILDGDFHTPLAGVAQDVEITLALPAGPTRIAGAMLWTHFGISGPAALDASRHWHAARLAGAPIRVSVNFLPAQDFARAEQRLIDLAAASPRAAIQTVLASLLPARLATALLALDAIDPQMQMSQLPRELRRKIVHRLTAFELLVRDSRGFAYAEVTAGGIPLDEIHVATMESRVCPGLYLVGEILDVDGRLGGFNFQWAWSSAHVAGRALAQAR